MRRARTKVLDEVGRELDLKLSQKIYSKILAAPLAERKGHTGNMVARVSEFSIVRDFFASTTIVLIVDLVGGGAIDDAIETIQKLQGASAITAASIAFSRCRLISTSRSASILLRAMAAARSAKPGSG